MWIRNLMKFLILSCIILFCLIISYIGFYYFSMRDIKTPSYKVVKTVGSIQVRQYSQLLLAEVNITGDRDQAINDGFRLLAKFIFGDNINNSKINMTSPVMQYSTKIAMTAPVMQQAQADNTWKIQFIMPSEYTFLTLPKPKNTNIKIFQQPVQQFIVIQFSGIITEASLQKHLEQLKKYIIENNINAIGPEIYAFYNPPWTLPFLRRNEIMFAIGNAS